MADRLQKVCDYVQELLHDKGVHGYFVHGELILDVRPEFLVDVMAFLHDDPKCKFMMLVDIAGVDFPARPQRFDVVYQLLSHTHNMRIRVKLMTDEETPVPSLVALFPAAGWYEREVWDMYGVLFAGNPDLRRILTDYGFDGHPLRKDFPLTGYVELRYNPEKKAVVYEPVNLPQAYRDFDYMSPWEGARYVLPGDEKAKVG
ncbi:MAG: NADH-quinone oxidoreductase subunit C [Alphaproteobacteria bacterium]|nr:MAG: NADH-quinone oxidoreductase subunit C [Alphaproteobacteria bacterium]